MAALLLGILEEGPVTLALEDYAGLEKVEPLGQSLSTGDSQTTTRAGNIVLNQPILQYSSEIRSAVLVIHGEKAHSCYMGREAYEGMMEGNPNPENKELMIIPGAVHTDLYDNLEIIPLDKIQDFFRTYLK